MTTVNTPGVTNHNALNTDTLYLGGVEVTATAAELNAIDIATAGVVQASKAVKVDANKDIGDFRNLDAVNIDAGASGTAGSVDVFPGTASKGKLAITCADQSGNTTVTLSAAAMGQATAIAIPDPGAAAAKVVLSTNAVTLAEADVLDGATAGTAVASKALVVDANIDIGTLRNVTATGTVQAATLKATTALVFENGASDITITANGTNVVITNLPTSDPSVAGALWVDTGVLKLSAGS